jgi:hypothetical protein
VILLKDMAGDGGVPGKDDLRRRADTDLKGVAVANEIPVVKRERISQDVPTIFYHRPE